MNRGPIFIGGIERSGKTYVRLMLSAHPDIMVSRRTKLWTHFYNRFGDLSQPANLERCLAAMLRSRHIALLHPDPHVLRAEFAAGPATYERLFGLLHEQYARKLGKTCWGDQTELIEQFADPIFAAYPNARMIHLIRDPRDRYQAGISRRRQNKGRIGISTARWRYSARLAAENQRRFPAQYRVLRYESLVTNPEGAARALCDFLGIDYVPAMLTLESEARFQRPHPAETAAPVSPLTTRYIGLYRGEVPHHELAFIQAAARLEMLKFGYLLENLQLSLADWLHYSFSFGPHYLAGLLALRRMKTAGQFE